MKQIKSKRNYLLLGASLLLVGLVVEILSDKILTLQMNIFYKTLFIMLMIAIGYSFAETIIAPFAIRFLKILQRPFKKAGGKHLGSVLFYIFIYVLLFCMYLFVFVYGMNIPWF